MQEVGAITYGEFAQLLEQNPAEFDHLCNSVLINVTAFFRDGVPWDALASEIVPRILENKRPEDPIRVWSAGCASGEEAYTLAMVLAEPLGVDALRTRVKIYATDVDEQALTIARHATYDSKRVEGAARASIDISNAIIATRFADLRPRDLRRNDPAGYLSRASSFVCVIRDVFRATTQARILAGFHFALNDTGYLFLGRAETLLAHNESFTPVDLKRRIFMKVPKTNYRNRLLAMAGNQDDPPPEPSSAEVRLRDASWEVSPLAQIIVDAKGNLVVANDRARALFNLGVPDFGRPFHDLELSYRPRPPFHHRPGERWSKPLVVTSVAVTQGDAVDRRQAAPLYPART